MKIRRRSGNFQFQEDLFSKKVQGIGRLYLEVSLLMKFLQTKPQVMNRNNIFYDLYYTVIKNINETEVVVENYKNIYFNINDYKTRNHYIGRRNINEMLM